MSTRRHGARAHWPADDVMYVGEDENVLLVTPANDWASLYTDGEGAYLDVPAEEEE